MPRKKSKNDSLPEIDLGAFSDIAFLLIIFFILTTTFVRNHGEKLEIPAGSSSEKSEQKQLTVSLNAKIICYGEKSEEMSLDDLQKALAKEKLVEKSEKERMVILDTSDDVPYELYFKVVSTITQADGILALVQHGEKKP